MILEMLSFGKHRYKPLTDVPTDYLCWLLQSGVRLGSGLRSILVAEVERRGFTPPPTPSRRWPADRPCGRCGVRQKTYRWALDSLSRRYIRAACAGCDKSQGAAPSTPPYTTAADATEALAVAEPVEGVASG